jgi:hypothetical protein
LKIIEIIQNIFSDYDKSLDTNIKNIMGRTLNTWKLSEAHRNDTKKILDLAISESGKEGCKNLNGVF